MTIPDGTLCFIDGPIWVYLDRSATVEQVLESCPRTFRLAIIAALQLELERVVPEPEILQ